MQHSNNIPISLQIDHIWEGKTLSLGVNFQLMMDHHSKSISSSANFEIKETAGTSSLLGYFIQHFFQN